MTATSVASTVVESAVRTTVVVGDDQTIGVSYFTDHPVIGSFEFRVEGATVYLTAGQALALYHRLGDVLVAAGSFTEPVSA